MATAPFNHLDRLLVTINLAARPISRAGFGTLLIVADQAAGNTLGGTDRVRSYASNAAAVADSGNLSALVLSMIAQAFSQARRPTAVKVGRVDTAGAETYADGYAAIKAADPDFYGVITDARDATKDLLVSAAVEADGARLFFLQDDDPDFLTSGLPSAYSALSSRERSSVLWHDSNAVLGIEAWVPYRLTFNPDSVSAVWMAALAGVAVYSSTVPSDTQKGFLKANFVNYIAQMGAEAAFLMPGCNTKGRPLYELVTADWFKARLQEDVQQLIVTETAAGRKIPVSDLGQTQILAIIRQRQSQGETAGHFKPGNTQAQAEAISAADLAAQRLRFTADSTIAVGLTDVQFDIYFSTTDIADQG